MPDSVENSTFNTVVKVLGLAAGIVVQGAVLYGYLTSQIDNKHYEAMQAQSQLVHRVVDIEKDMIRREGNRPAIERMDRELVVIMERMADNEALSQDMFRKILSLERAIVDAKSVK